MSTIACDIPGPDAPPRDDLPPLEAFLALQVGFALERDVPADAGGKPVLLYGFGRHTRWMMARVPAFWSVPLAAVIDDADHGELRVDGKPIMTPEAARDRFGPSPTVILSTDTWQASMTDRIRAVFGDGARVIDLYRGLAPGPYTVVDAPAPVPPAPVPVMAAHPSETCVRRTVRALVPWLEREGVRRVGVTPTTAGAARRSVREELARAGVLDAGPAPSALVDIDAGYEQRRGGLPPRRADGPLVITPWIGPQPWFDRHAVAPARETPCDDAVRIAILHPNHLGDVVLSQGILPERLKTETYPNATISFATSSACATRQGSNTTGWCVDLLAHHPWIDEVIELDESGGAAAWDRCRERADFVYELWNGWLYHHVFDLHAMLVELPPGRTDARVHLSDADRALARRVLDGAGGPRIAVNMGLIAERIRGWGKEKTAALCDAIEQRLGGTVVWIGWVDFAGHARLAIDGRPLTVREQAAVIAECDLHVTTQGAGANLSAAVGTQTLSLTGMHPACREGVAQHANPYVEDPSRRHVEISRYHDELRVLTHTSGEPVPWALRPGETEAEVGEYLDHLWFDERPPEQLGPLAGCEWYARVRRLTVEDVVSTVAAILEARRTGRPAPGR